MKELVEKIMAELEPMQKDMNANLKGSKAAGVRARRHTLTLEKLFKEYRKASLAEAKLKGGE